MDTKSFEVLNVLLKSYREDSIDSMLKFFPENEAKLISNLQHSKSKEPLTLLPLLKRITNIHYSWFFPIIKKLPSDLVPFVLGVFPKSYVAGLIELFWEKTRVSSSPEPIQTFFLKTLHTQVGLDQILPKSFLPESPLNKLLLLDKHAVVKLIDYLGLHDLTIALKKIVDKKQVEKIFKLLSASKRQYLKQCVQSKDPLTFSIQTIHKWTNSSESLMILVHQKGLMRLSKAIAGQHPHFIWHLAHLLDTGRGEKLLQFSRNKEPGKYTAILCTQILNLMQMLKPKGQKQV